MAQPILAWTNLRAFAAQTGEATAIPAANLFVPVPGLALQGNTPRLVEFAIDPSTPPAVGGTANPTSVVIKIYRAFVTGDAQRHLLYTWTISATDITNNEVQPIILEGYAGLYYARVSFNGGTAPTFTGTLMARATE